MAALGAPTRVAQRLLRARFASPTAATLSRTCARSYSSEPEPPPLLQKIKGDLKTAMRAKDAPRLTVIRSILAAAQNQAKVTQEPVSTDAQVLALLRRAQRAAADAASEFEAAGRADLVSEEQAQAAVLSEYAAAASGVDEPSEAQMRAFADEVVAREGRSKTNPGRVMKALLEPGGPLADFPGLDKARLAHIVKEVLQYSDRAGVLYGALKKKKEPKRNSKNSRDQSVIDFLRREL
ncbi:GatB/YqeY domain-containing protein [Hypoxylon sp. FL1284]|nr:GatB/YqeY domain-containing protein [Hypoxylon sp. FL1284]